MGQQRRDILTMLAEGKITADEAEQLIAALDREAETASNVDSRTKPKAKYLRVLVDTTEGNGDGPARVNVRVPLQLLRAGVRLASLVPANALGQANHELQRNGVQIDLSQLKPEQLEELVDYLDEMTVEVDQPDAKVRVFCE